MRRGMRKAGWMLKSGHTRIESRRGMIASPSGRGDGAECGVRFGRRMLLGSVSTAVALSEFGRPRLALSEGDGGNEKVKVKGGDSSASVENGEGETAGPQFGEKWKMSRVYDATALGEPLAVGGNRSRVWQKLLQARVVYLGESERLPDPDDRVPYLARAALSVLNLECPRLATLSLHACGIGPQMLEVALEGCTMLETLDLRNCTQITPASLAPIRGLCPNIKRLYSTSPPEYRLL